MPNLEKNIAALEALLFIHGEPVTYKKIAAVLGVEKEEAEKIAIELEKRLEDDGRGLQLVSDREKVQLATKPEWNGILESFMKEELTEDLTPASLETLSIIVYLGPIARVKIEYLRGVNSSVILRSLMIRGLVERFQDSEHPVGFLYRPTFDAMKHLGIKQKEDLPDFVKFQELLKVFDVVSAETAAAGEAVVGKAEERGSLPAEPRVSSEPPAEHGVV
ncbi:MAG: SMC-Scp complex subunit ScpB [Minisyncoccia bacterium]